MAAQLDTEFVTVSEAARLLKVGTVTIYRWLKQGRLHAYRVGPRKLRIRKQDLLAMVKPAGEGKEVPMVTRERVEILKMSPEEAFELAERFARPTVYDTHYVALANLLACELWTADETLLNALGGQLPFVKSIRAYPLHP